MSKKKKKDEERASLDVRNKVPFFSNYDYGGPSEGSGVGSGTGLYDYMYQNPDNPSVGDFLEKARKRRHRKKGITRIILKIAQSYQDEWADKIEEIAKNNTYPFNDWFPEGNRVYLPFKSAEHSAEALDSQAEEIISILKEKFPDKCQDVDFIGGLCKSNKNSFKIGKLLSHLKNSELKKIQQEINNGSDDPQKIEELNEELTEKTIYWDEIIKAFTSSPARIGIKDQDLDKFVVISQDPHDMAKMSTERKWDSCTRLPLFGDEGGKLHQDVFCEVEDGGLIAYLIEEGDKDIDDPIARVRIRRFTNIEGKSFALMEDKVYGDDEPGFTQTVQQWLDSHQRSKMNPGLYNMHGGAYSDTFPVDEEGGVAIVAPEEEEKLLEWFNQPLGVEGSVVSYWRVIDVMRSESPDLFDSEEGVLSHLKGDWPIEKVFADEFDAQAHASNINHSNIIDERIWRLEELADSYLEREDYSEYLDDDFVPATLKSEESDRSEVIRKAVIAKVNSAQPGVFSKNIIQNIGRELFNNYSKYSSQAKEFIDKNAVNHPEIAYLVNLENPKKGDEIILLNKLAEKLPFDSEEKKLVDDTIMRASREVLEVLAEGPLDPRTRSYAQIYLNALEGTHQPLPNDLIKTLFSIIEANQGGPNYNGIVNDVLYSLQNTRNEAAKDFYRNLLPNVQVTPRKSGEGTVSFTVLGRNLAKLGSEGEEFLPWLYQKIEEAKEWIPKPGEGYDYTMYERGGQTFKTMKEKFEKKKDSIIDTLLYVIDSIKSGKGYSTEHRFFIRP